MFLMYRGDVYYPSDNVTTRRLPNGHYSKERINKAQMLSNSYPYNFIHDPEDFGIFFELALAGFDKKEISVKVIGDKIRITAEKNVERELTESMEYIHKGISYKRFDETYKVDSKFDLSKIDPMYKNGLLTIHIPLKTQNSEKVIEIRIQDPDNAIETKTK